jgi:hypothetical protein
VAAAFEFDEFVNLEFELGVNDRFIHCFHFVSLFYRIKVL